MSMRAEDLMSRDVVCCPQDTNVREVALMMVEHDCGMIPVVRSADERALLGVITDRDICCRVVAEGRDPEQIRVGDVMSEPVVSVQPDTSIQEIKREMTVNQVRRLPVTDAQGRCIGVISQADIARQAPQMETGEVVQQVSRPTDTPSQVSPM